jgi:hypothetical protein
MGSTIYYGAKDENNKLDTTQAYNKGEADFSGTTSCKNSIFGDPLPGTSKFCFCDELSSALHPVEEFCANNGEDCECGDGNYVNYGKATLDQDNKTALDFSYKHW